jgi:predicted O-linked N-acetylglucosamine transferase (SPINDLY family)
VESAAGIASARSQKFQLEKKATETGARISGARVGAIPERTFRAGWVPVAFSAISGFSVMPGLVPGIHAFRARAKTWMAGTSPAMTMVNPIGKRSKRSRLDDYSHAVSLIAALEGPLANERSFGSINCPQDVIENSLGGSMPETGDARPQTWKPALAALEAKFNQGTALHRQGKLADAERCYVEVLQQQADHFGALHLLGVIALQTRRTGRGVELIQKAIGRDPKVAEAHNNLGTALRYLKRCVEAVASYDKAIALKPDYVEAHYNRGNALTDLKRYREAFAAYDMALTLKPDLAAAWGGRANLLHKLKRHEEAAKACSKVLAIEPQSPFFKGILLHQRMLSCNWRGIEDLIAEIDSDVASGERSAEPFSYQAVARSARDFKRCAEIFAAHKYPRSKTPLWRGERYDNGKIRVGYLSGEFRDHVTSTLMTELFELHDKNRFELFAFDNGWDDGSELRGRINKAFNTIVDISRLDDLHVATMIKQKQIDILVNLNGYFGEHRTRVFGYKPSPIQASYLGFSATMGTDYIDYIIADRYVIPPEHRTFYTERVVYLPHTFQVNDSKRQVAIRTPARAESMLPDIGFVFCCFNNNFKITPDVFDCWLRILRRVDGSVMWLSEHNAKAAGNLRKEAEIRGVDPERLVFAKRTPSLPDHLARHRLADLFLDTIPFNAGATASDALWAGLPLLTCSGETYTARMAGSLLNAIGLPELITTTLDAYEQMAVDLATHPEKLAAIRHKLAENRLIMPLFDTQLFTNHIEAAYSAMYERYQAGLPPDDIVVPN